MPLRTLKDPSLPNFIPIPHVTDKDHIRGPFDAAVTLVEYGDYECPDCLASEPIVTELLDVSAGKIRAVFRHFPRNSIHPRASVAAAAAEAAGMQQRFWDMHAALFRHQKELVDLDLTHLALRLGLDVYRFSRDLESPVVLQKVTADFDAASGMGLKRTPTFFVNDRAYDGPLVAESILAAVGQQ